MSSTAKWTQLQPAEEFFYKAYNVSFWTMPEADAVEWLNTQFGTSLE